MLPRWHIFWGAVFTGIIWLASPGISKAYLALIFLASFLIDFDHYVNAGMKGESWKLKDALDYHRKLGKKMDLEHARGARKKYDFHLFHTLEFHILMALLGILWTGFFYIFIGMVFHSLLDLIYGANRGVLYRREYFFFNWMRKKLD